MGTVPLSMASSEEGVLFKDVHISLAKGDKVALFINDISRLPSPTSDDPNDDTTVMVDKKELKPPEESASKLEAAPESLEPVEDFLAAVNFPFIFNLPLFVFPMNRLNH